MKPINSLIMLILFMASLLSFASAQDADGVLLDAGTKKENRPVEIIVTPTFKLSDIRNLILSLEEDFIVRFNELNTDDDYDVLCYNFVPTMSHRKVRTCEPNFLVDARASNASEAAADLGRAVTDQDRYEIYVATPRALRKDKHREYETFQSKLVEFAESDESMNAIAVEIDRLNTSLKNFGKDD